MAASILKLLGEKLRSYSRSSSLNVINVENKSSSEGERSSSLNVINVENKSSSEEEGEGEYAKKLLFEMWAKSHKIVYESEEEKMKRFEIFKDTLRHIKKTNEESIRQGLSLRLGLTPYAAMTYEEFCSKCLGRLILDESDNVTMEENKGINNPADFRE